MNFYKVIKYRLFGVVSLLLLFFLPIQALAREPLSVELISFANDDTQGNEYSEISVNAISSDSHYVAFFTGATNLISSDTNGVEDVILYNRATGDIERISLPTGDGHSNNPRISADGRYIAYISEATNLVPGDTNGEVDLFVYDTSTQETERVSVSSSEEEADGYVEAFTISADGRYVVFDDGATNLVADDTNDVSDIFMRDRDTGETTRISVSSDGDEADDESFSPAISSDGNYIAFESSATNLVAGDTNGITDVFIYNRQTGDVTRASLSTAGVQTNGYSISPSLSSDGRYVVFSSRATNLVADDTNATSDIFVRDLQLNITTRVNVSSSGTQANDSTTYFPIISGDGRYVVFSSIATNLVADDTNGIEDIFIRDRELGETSIVSVSMAGVKGDNESNFPSISSDGNYVVFMSQATNLVAGDLNNKTDIFLVSYAVPDFSEEESEPAPSVSRSSGSTHYGCKDPNAINYEYFSRSTPSICKYANVFTPTLNSSNSLSSCFIIATLRFGNKGEQVKCLQGKLEANPKLIFDGVFGKLTKTAVINFQKLHSLVPDGIVGSLTRAELSK